MSNKIISIGNRKIGKGYPCFIIAEAGVNHDGELTKALKMIDIAVVAKADAVKFQTFTGDTLASKDAMLATYHKKGSISKNETLKELLYRLELSEKDHKEIFQYAKKKGLHVFSTPFDERSADFLVELGVDLFKIASFSLTNYPLLEHIAKKNLPMIMSTGLHTLGEIELAVNVIKSTGNKNLALLQCTSHYPSEPKDANLKVMKTLSSAFDVPIGYSDHTIGINISLASVALGANIVEKHFTFNTESFGVDHDASIGPDELAKMVKEIREIEESLGTTVKLIPEIEKEIQRVHRPSLVSKIDIPKGTIITRDMLVIKKPGTGIHPRDIEWVIGRKTKQNIEADRLIRKDFLI